VGCGFAGSVCGVGLQGKSDWGECPHCRGLYSSIDPISEYSVVTTRIYLASNPVNVFDYTGQFGAVGGFTSADAYCSRYPRECINSIAKEKPNPKIIESDDCCPEYELLYEENPKHGIKRRMAGRKSIARRPTNGAAALINSREVIGSALRIGYDMSSAELVALPLARVDDQRCIKYYHGWVIDYHQDIWGRPELETSIRNSDFPTPW